MDEARGVESLGCATLSRFISSTEPTGKDIATICSTAARQSLTS
jgi:hypothetical protein